MGTFFLIHTLKKSQELTEFTNLKYYSIIRPLLFRPFSMDLLRAVFTLDEQSTKGFALDAVPEMAALRSGSDRVALVARNFAAVAGLEWAWFVTEGEDAKYLDR